MTLYRLKPKFQALLRPWARWIHDRGGTANQVTVAAAVGSVALGLILGVLGPSVPGLFAILPVWMVVRMALNAIDGLLAREFGQKSALGAYLNELTDPVSDAALILPFARVWPLSPTLVVVVALAASWSELAGVLGPTLGASRRYDGPLGKSDRALVFGALGAWIAWSGGLPWWTAAVPPILVLASAATVVNRVRTGLAETRRP